MDQNLKRRPDNPLSRSTAAEIRTALSRCP